jgi:hypothetical protein
MHKCDRCGFNSRYKHVLMNHLRRQEVCKPVLSDVDVSELIDKLNEIDPKKKYACICGALFTTTTSRCRHRKTCNQYQQSNTPQSIQNISNTAHQLITNSHIDNLVNIHQNNIAQPVQVNFKRFDRPEIAYMENAIIKITKQNTRSNPHTLMRALPEVARHMYFNKNHPENHTVFIPNLRDKFAKVFDGRNWIIKSKKQVIDVMRDESVYAIRDVFYDNQESFTIMEQQHVKNFTQKHADEDPQFYKDSAEAIEETILSYQPIAKKTYNALMIT